VVLGYQNSYELTRRRNLTINNLLGEAGVIKTRIDLFQMQLRCYEESMPGSQETNFCLAFGKEKSINKLWRDNNFYFFFLQERSLETKS
jgi:hypothetical protein